MTAAAPVVAVTVWARAREVTSPDAMNWVKGDAPGTKRLYTQLVETRGRPWIVREVDRIHATLTDGPDASRWAAHFIRAEPHCSPGLRDTLAQHVARHRPRPPGARRRTTAPKPRPVRPQPRWR